MRPSESISRRIVAAFVLFGVVLSLLFAVLAVVAVEGIEVYLVDDRLSDVQKWALPRDAAGLKADLPAGLKFQRGEAIPGSLRGLPHGVSDMEVDGIGMHVLSGSDENGPYVIVDHESDYEKVELLVYSVFAACFVGFVLLAAFLGRFVGRQIVIPMSKLADAVADGSPAIPFRDRKDELGILARALAAHTAEMRGFLDRERFFTGDVSHELRTPLTVIMGAAEILLSDSRDPAVLAPAQRIYEAALEATECITVLLLLARAPEIGMLSKISVSELAKGETERYRPMAVGKRITLRCIGNASIDVRAPAELCSCAIANLIRNACQYTEQGEVRVLLEPSRVIVEDTGPGLPAAVQNTLAGGINPIASGESTGTGLGLSLVRRICEYLGASLHYEPRPGGGSRFMLTFPANFTQT